MKKSLRILLVLCLALALFAVPAVGVSASTTTAIDATLLREDTKGDGWEWIVNDKKLILYGIDISGASGIALELSDGTKLELHGYNQLTSTADSTHPLICCYGQLTIRGSGILSLDQKADVEAVNVTNFYQQEGYFKAKSAATTKSCILATEDVTIRGGCIEASGGTSAIETVTYSQWTGYIKASGTGNGVKATTIEVNAGYLEAEGACTLLGNVKNKKKDTGTEPGSGVIKATATGANGIDGALTASAGVTIVSGSTKAISGLISGSGSGEYIYDNRVMF